MPHKMPPIAISSDIVGMLGEISLLHILYGTGFSKVELIGWYPKLNQHLNEAQKNGFQVTRIHGRLYSVKKPELISWGHIILYLGNNLIIPSEELFKNYAADCDVLLHHRVFNDSGMFYLAQKYQTGIKLLWIENDQPGEDGVGSCLKVVEKLRRSGVNAGVCLDLAHYFGPNLFSPKFTQYWTRLLKYLENTFIQLVDNEGEHLPISFHFPIGTDLRDSLPLDSSIDIPMLKEFTSIIKRSNTTLITLENQNAGYFHNLVLFKKQVKAVTERNKKVINLLQESGFFS